MHEMLVYLVRGHSALRTWAMGERAFDEPGTDGDLERLYHAATKHHVAGHRLECDHCFARAHEREGLRSGDPREPRRKRRRQAVS